MSAIFQNAMRGPKTKRASAYGPGLQGEKWAKEQGKQRANIPS